MAEKLLSTREVCQFLGLSEEKLRKLVDEGKIPAYRLGGTLLRFRKDQIERIKGRGIDKLTVGKTQEHPAAADYNQLEKLKDFLYFNDFYIVSGIVVIILLTVIFFY
ncbi:MAG: helix-turn-helix domain-containing protein [Candidatus Omnitrophica bacterium]|nr:helix-turn-helix domain-containing protein [Candidatus Omnitrophota bacterium]